MIMFGNTMAVSMAKPFGNALEKIAPKGLLERKDGSPMQVIPMSTQIKNHSSNILNKMEVQ